MNQKVYQALTVWRQGLLARNLMAPSDADLRRVAEEAYGWPAAGLEPITEGYRDNIQELQKQVRFGVVDPVEQATDQIWVARPGLPSAAPAQTDSGDGSEKAQRRQMLTELEALINRKRQEAPSGHPVHRGDLMNRLRRLNVRDA